MRIFTSINMRIYQKLSIIYLLDSLFKLIHVFMSISNHQQFLLNDPPI
jgi:hypothetical protein